jgi:hypothetical protein
MISSDTKLAISAGSLFGFLLMVRDACKRRDREDAAEIRRQVDMLAAVQKFNDEEALRKSRLVVPPFPITPPVTPPVAPPVEPLPTALRQLTGSPLHPIPGRKYYVTAQVEFPATLIASISAVQGQAQDHGFVDVGVSDKRPENWPSTAKGNYFVTGRYAGVPTPLDRSYVAGQVKIVDVWEEG